MSRWLVGMSGDKDAMIAHLEKCEKRMLEQFSEIRDVALNIKGVQGNPNDAIRKRILALCDVYVDKRSDKQKMQDQIDELKEQVRRLTEGDE